jgi:hypothetical protein
MGNNIKVDLKAQETENNNWIILTWDTAEWS